MYIITMFHTFIFTTYNNLRPHGLLKYLTPKFICNIFSSSNDKTIKDLEISLEKLTLSVKK